MSNSRYLMQVLLAVAKGCRPNSPHYYQTWTFVIPLPGIPEYGDALATLVRCGFLERGSGFKVRPSSQGYERIAAWKAYRKALRARPVMFDRLLWDVGAAQEEVISVPDGKDALGAAHYRGIGNRRVSTRPSRQIDRSLQIELHGTKPMRGTLAHAVMTGEVASDLMYRVAPYDTIRHL